MRKLSPDIVPLLLKMLSAPIFISMSFPFPYRSKAAFSVFQLISRFTCFGTPLMSVKVELWSSLPSIMNLKASPAEFCLVVVFGMHAVRSKASINALRMMAACIFVDRVVGAFIGDCTSGLSNAVKGL